MDTKQVKENIITTFVKALDERVSYDFGDQAKLIFNNNWISLVLFDSRLKSGDNTRKVVIANPITESEFATFTEKALTVCNNPKIIQYKYSHKDMPELPLPSIEDTINKIKAELSMFVDLFIEQVKLNNEYLNPTITKLNLK
jgi:hypothetical protein